jgi:hypothetical protein
MRKKEKVKLNLDRCKNYSTYTILLVKKIRGKKGAHQVLTQKKLETFSTRWSKGIYTIMVSDEESAIA